MLTPPTPMDAADDRRRYPRLPCPKGTILAWETVNRKLVSRIENLGLGGLYIRTPDPPSPGAFIQLLFDVPAGEVRARALVQRIKPKHGMAVKFIYMDQTHRGRFSNWIKTLN